MMLNLPCLTATKQDYIKIITEDTMSRHSMKQVLMDRDGLTEEEAEAQVDDARANLMALIENGDMESAMDVCYDYGLEPDYLEDLI